MSRWLLHASHREAGSGARTTVSAALLTNRFGGFSLGLSNTCPQASVMRSPVLCDGQVSDKPKL